MPAQGVTPPAGKCECKESYEFIAYANPTTLTGLVHWTAPEVTCPDYERVQEDPPGIKSPANFSIGRRVITYLFSYERNGKILEFKCYVNFTVVACECPCTQTLNITAEFAEESAFVSWLEPKPRCPATASSENPKDTSEMLPIGNHRRSYQYTYNSKYESFDVYCHVKILIVRPGCLQSKWTEYRGVCYTGSSKELSWLKARNDCMNKGGDIARVTDKDVNEFILKRFRKSEHIWIGLTRCSFNKTKWCYPDGTVTVYTNWDKIRKEPNNERGIEDCTEMYFDGTWNDYPCKLSRSYVCQRPFDVDECHLGTSQCSPDAKCANTIGSYTCTCNEGFTGDGTVCQDIDECSIGMYSCHSDAVCINIRGSFKCICKIGYYGDGTFCHDIDECATNKHNCDSRAVCTNTKGFFNCSCKDGYSGDGKLCDDSHSLSYGKLKNQAQELYNNSISFEARKRAAQNIVDELSYLTHQDLNNGEKNGTARQQNITDTVRILQNIVNLNISDSSLNILGPASNILNSGNTESWRKIKDEGVIRDLVMTLENYGFQCGNNLENNTYNSSVFQNRSNVQLHVKYLKSNVKLAQKERLFNFSNASFSLSPDALATESGAVVVILWYKTLNSFLGKSLSGKNVYATVNNKIISASVRPEPRMPFREPVRITWDTIDLVESEECVYWKPELSENRWKTDGCTKVPDEHRLICECKHLTAFASMDISRNMIHGAIKKEKKALNTTHTTYAFSKNNLSDGVSKSESGTPVFLKKIMASSPFAVKKRYNLEHSSNETLKRNDDDFVYTKGSSMDELN